jgi:hypothetical protein
MDYPGRNSAAHYPEPQKISSRIHADIGVDSIHFALSNESGCVAEAGAADLMGRTGPFCQDKKDIKETLQNNVT